MTSLLFLGFIRGAVAPQQPDATARSRDTSTVEHPPARKNAKSEAEKRRRYPDIIEGADLDKKVGWLARGHYVGMTVLTSADEQTTYLIVRRTTSSQPEWHARWDDLVIVRSGAGVIVFGDSLVGSTLRAPGERRGGTFTRNYQIVVRPGDIVRIPAAVPHAFVVAGKEPLEFLLVKTRRQNLPIRWMTSP
jgi:mannose-6-phosphate isomerase-like protein (cupin superfamily)